MVLDMNPLKALGPNGLSSIFFKHYWSTIGCKVVAAVQSFFRKGWMLREMN